MVQQLQNKESFWLGWTCSYSFDYVRRRWSDGKATTIEDAWNNSLMLGTPANADPIFVGNIGETNLLPYDRKSN